MTKNWEEYKETICQLYKQEGVTLEDVRNLMEEKHNFRASTRSYRDKLSRWNAYKFSSRRLNRSGSMNGRSPVSSYDSGSPNRSAIWDTSPDRGFQRTGSGSSLSSMSSAWPDRPSLNGPAMTPGSLYSPSDFVGFNNFKDGSSNLLPIPDDRNSFKRHNTVSAKPHVSIEGVDSGLAQQVGHLEFMCRPTQKTICEPNELQSTSEGIWLAPEEELPHDDAMHPNLSVQMISEMIAKEREMDISSQDVVYERDTPKDWSSRKSPQVGPRILACPYSKRFPERFSTANTLEEDSRKCSTCWITEIKDLKKHLYSNHRCPKHYCCRCYQIFSSTAEVERHQDLRGKGPKCDKIPCPWPEKMSELQEKRIREQPLSLDVSDAWMKQYRILFDDIGEDEVPLSPYADEIDVKALKPWANYFSTCVSNQLDELLSSTQEEALNKCFETVVAKMTLAKWPFEEDMGRDHTGRDLSFRDHIDTISPMMEEQSRDISDSFISLVSSSALKAGIQWQPSQLATATKRVYRNVVCRNCSKENRECLWHKGGGGHCLECLLQPRSGEACHVADVCWPAKSRLAIPSHLSIPLHGRYAAAVRLYKLADAVEMDEQNSSQSVWEARLLSEGDVLPSILRLPRASNPNGRTLTSDRLLTSSFEDLTWLLLPRLTSKGLEDTATKQADAQDEGQRWDVRRDFRTIDECSTMDTLNPELISSSSRFHSHPDNCYGYRSALSNYDGQACDLTRK